MGHLDPYEDCASGQRPGLDGDIGAAVYKLGMLLATQHRQTQMTFINLGAGTCGVSDPLYPLLHTESGTRFSGIVADMNSEDLRVCAQILQHANVSAISARITLEPPLLAQHLRGPLRALFTDVDMGEINSPAQMLWPLDLLVVDIDSFDCLIAEEALYLVQPKVLIIELAYHVPPPFRYCLQYDANSFAEWLTDYNVQAFNPASGCSLSYAISKFRSHDMHLLQLVKQDAIFVHSSILPMLEHHLDVRFPQDEFQCYRQSRLWLQFPALYVREWFFVSHPAESLHRIWENMSSIGRLHGRVGAPFTLSY